MPPSTGQLGFFSWLFGFGVDVAARRAIDRQLKILDDTANGILKDHSPDALVDGIEEARVAGVAAMGGSDE
jgi:hypothetical protein